MEPSRALAACRRCSGTRTGCRTLCTVGSRLQPRGRHLDATDMQGGADSLAAMTERGHGRFPPPTAVAAGRQIEYGNSGRAGTVGRGSRRRACAVVCELALGCPAWKRVIGRSADLVEPSCHGGNLRRNNRRRCHALQEKLAFRPNLRFHADCVCSTSRSRHPGKGRECLKFDPTRTFKVARFGRFCPGGLTELGMDY